jgi:hypothetical protein
MQTETITRIARYQAVLFAITGLALIGTGALKLAILAAGNEDYGNYDPLIPWIRNDLLLVFVGLVEIVVGTICLRDSNTGNPAFFLAWLGTLLAVYRGLSQFFDDDRSCNCFGNIGQILLGDAVMETISFLFLIWMLVLAYGALVVINLRQLRGGS